MDSGKLAMLLFDAGFLFMLAAMILGPFEVTDWSLVFGIIACLFGVASFVLGLQYWDELEEQDLQMEAEKQTPDKQTLNK